jgi:cytoskeletal protein CcmA (bactofilin family)
MAGTEKESLNRAGRSSVNPSGTSGYFDAWLKDLGPVFELEPAPVVQPTADPTTDSSPANALEFEGTLRIDCFAKGRLRSLRGTLVVSETGKVEAELNVGVAIIEGRLVGDIHATERVEIGSHARVIGDIETPTLSIQPGAVFEGRCTFLPPPPAVEAETNNSRLAQSNPCSTPTQGATDTDDEPVARLVAVAR